MKNLRSKLFVSALIAGTAFGLNSFGAYENTTGTGAATPDTTATDTTTTDTTSSSMTTTSDKTKPSVLDQSTGTAQDVEVTRRIREELNKSEKLSTSAKNIDVITLDNVVTVRGTVNSQDEKQRIMNVARGAAGTRTVRDELVVDTTKR